MKHQKPTWFLYIIVGSIASLQTAHGSHCATPQNMTFYTRFGYALALNNAGNIAQASHEFKLLNQTYSRSHARTL